MSGIVLWTYFQGCMEAVANSLSVNAGIFGKVYFPRLIPPLAIVINNLARLGLNFVIFLVFWVYYYGFTLAKMQPNLAILALPLIVLYCGLLGLGIGLLLTSLTVKFRDIVFVIPFLGQVWMFMTPVPYAMSSVSWNYQWLFCFNPMAGVVEIYRYAFLGIGTISAPIIFCNLAIAFFLLFVGLMSFNRVQRTFIDTI
jgi:lipopolysaccharide transport system permease protein